MLVEKPMVTNTTHAYELWRLVKKSGKLLGITFQAPYTQTFGYLAGARESGTLGRIHAINGWISQGWLAMCKYVAAGCFPFGWRFHVRYRGSSSQRNHVVDERSGD